MVFEVYDTERLTAWKEFRDSLEDSNTPFDDVIELWSKAPFVNSYLNPHHPASWPDPWHLMLDGKYDDLGLVLGMLHTLKLTQRFEHSKFELYSTLNNNSTTYFLIVDSYIVLNFEYKQLIYKNDLPDIISNLLWAC